MTHPPIMYDADLVLWTRQQLEKHRKNPDAPGKHFVRSSKMAGDISSRCRRVNDEVTDLDKAYAKDRCAALLKLLTDLRYDGNGLPQPPGSLEFKPRRKKDSPPDFPGKLDKCHSFSRGMDSLRMAVEAYVCFRDETPLG